MAVCRFARPYRGSLPIRRRGVSFRRGALAPRGRRAFACGPAYASPGGTPTTSLEAVPSQPHLAATERPRYHATFMDRMQPPRWGDRRIWWVPLFGAIVWQGWMTLTLFGGPQPWKVLLDERPIVSGRHPLHLYHGYLGARALREHGSLSCYDPSFHAGYPKTPVSPRSQTPFGNTLGETPFRLPSRSVPSIRIQRLRVAIRRRDGIPASNG
jgi:hypothetical protein